MDKLTKEKYRDILVEQLETIDNIYKCYPITTMDNMLKIMALKAMCMENLYRLDNGEGNDLSS